LLRTSYIAAGCGVIVVVFGIVFLRYGPPRTQAAPATLVERWGDLAFEPTIRLVQTERIVKTERIVLTPSKAEETIVQSPVVVKLNRPKKIKQDRSEICSVHGMRKVYVSKYRWRCRR
jgi:hypothetical protein